MRKGLFFIAGIGLLFCLFLSNACESEKEASYSQALPDIVDFNWHIRPILSDRCYTCHGPDEKVREANLRLDTEEGAFAALEEGENRFALVPGDPDKSLLIKRVESTSGESIMPPPESNLILTEKEVAMIGKWIQQGAAWKEHWAFIPPKKSALPIIENKDWG